MAKRRKRRSWFRGLGAVGRRSLHPAVPVATAAILTAGTTLGLRAYLRPDPGSMSEKLYRWAPGLGALAGLLGAGALYFMSGPSAAVPAGLTALLSGGFVLGSERLNAAKSGGLIAVSGGAELPAETAAGAAGLRALLPEFQGTRGLGAIVMDPVSGIADPYGETVNIRGGGLGAGGYRPDAFGKSPI
jgi:hypothetical protein